MNKSDLIKEDLHIAVRNLNNRVKELNAAIEQGNSIEAHAIAKSVIRRSNTVANEIEYQAIFNNKDYYKWAKEVA